MSVSQYACNPVVSEISTIVKVDVPSTEPVTALSDCFYEAYIHKSFDTVTDVDKHTDFDKNFLVGIVDHVLDGMTIKTLINVFIIYLKWKLDLSKTQRYPHA